MRRFLRRLNSTWKLLDQMFHDISDVRRFAALLAQPLRFIRTFVGGTAFANSAGVLHMTLGTVVRSSGATSFAPDVPCQ